MIEELLKKKGGINNTALAPNQKHSDLFRRMEDLNSDYIGLIKKFQELQRENSNLFKVVEDLS